MITLKPDVKDSPPLGENCDGEDNSHALFVSWCGKQGSKRGILVDF